MNQLTTLAALPSGSGCAAALPAEVGEAKPRDSGLSTAEEILTRGAVEVGQPVPWEDTHESIESMSWDGRRWLHTGCVKTPNFRFDRDVVYPTDSIR